MTLTDPLTAVPVLLTETGHSTTAERRQGRTLSRAATINGFRCAQPFGQAGGVRDRSSCSPLTTLSPASGMGPLGRSSASVMGPPFRQSWDYPLRQ